MALIEAAQLPLAAGLGFVQEEQHGRGGVAAHRRVIAERVESPANPCASVVAEPI